MVRRIAVAAGIVALIALLVWLALREDRAADDSRTPAEAVSTSPRTGTNAPHARAKRADTPPATEEAAPAPLAPDRRSTISGRVIDADGNPIPGARVVSHPDDLTKPVDVARAGGEGSPSCVATSGADGRFEIRCDAATIESVLTATADAGFGQAAARPRDADVTIRLAKWTLLEGRVTNTANEAIEGAKVTAHLLLDALTEDRTAVTGADGSYRIERLPPVAWSPNVPYVGRGRHAWVVAEAEGYAPLLVERDPMGGPTSADPSRLDLVLVRGLTLSGRVVDGDTKAGIAGATVVCWSVEGMMSFGGPGGTNIRNPWGPRPLAETRTADDGSYRFEHLPAQGPSGVASHNIGKRGQTLGHVVAWKEGYVYSGDEIPVSKDGATVETSIELWPSATIVGRVVDSAGRPIEGAGVYASVDSRRPSINGFPDFYAESKKAGATSAADGTYRLTAFPASHNGPTTGTVVSGVRDGTSWVPSQQVQVTAEAGETVTAQDLVVALGAMPRAVFLVTDEAGAPVAGAVLEHREGGIRTGLDGRVTWVLGHVPKPDAPALTQKVVVRARGFVVQMVEFLPVRDTPPEVRVVLRGGGNLAGRVQMTDGSPAAKAWIVVTDGATTIEQLFPEMSFGVGRDRNGKPTAVVYAYVPAREDGKFEIRDLPEGPLLVVAAMPSRAPIGSGRPPKQLRDAKSGIAAGTTDLVLTIPLDDAPPTQALDVVVTDAAGADIAGCAALAISESLRIWAQPVENGKLRFAALPAGRWTVEVTAPGWAKATVPDVAVDAVAPPPPLKVRLDRGITLRGVVRTESESLPDGARIWLAPIEQTTHGGSIIAAEIGKDGSFEISGLLPERHRVIVQGAAGGWGAKVLVAPGNAALTLAEGAREATADLLVVRGGTVTLSVRDARLPAAPFTGGAGDAEKDKFGAASRVDVLDAAGAVVFAQSPIYTNSGGTTWLAPGDYTVRLRLSGEPLQEQRVTVNAGETVTARFPPR